MRSHCEQMQDEAGFVFLYTEVLRCTHEETPTPPKKKKKETKGFFTLKLAE